METINSVFDVLDGLTVEEMLANPTFLPDLVKEAKDGREVQKLFFRDQTANSHVVAYREALPPELEDGLIKTAEFGEIPVSDPVGSEWKTKMIEKYTLGIRVSWEQVVDNDGDAVKNELIARTNSILRSNARAALAAFNEADLQQQAAATAWDQTGANPAADILDAIELVQGAEDGEGHYYEYVPNVLWINPTTLNMLKRNEEVQKLYIGDMASENPLFKGVADEPKLFGNLQVVKSFFVPKGTAYVGTEGAAVMAEREPMQITDFYAEGGESKIFGPHMSQRSDVSHRRAFFVDNPKAIVEITGLVTE